MAEPSPTEAKFPLKRHVHIAILAACFGCAHELEVVWRPSRGTVDVLRDLVVVEVGRGGIREGLSKLTASENELCWRATVLNEAKIAECAIGTL
jgi:hypothetical protein